MFSQKVLKSAVLQLRACQVMASPLLCCSTKQKWQNLPFPQGGLPHWLGKGGGREGGTRKGQVTGGVKQVEGHSCFGPTSEAKASQVGPQCWDWRPLEPGLPLSFRLLLAVY